MQSAFKILPKNYLNDWGYFEDWESGVSDVPTGWLASTAATYAQDAVNKKFGNYGLAITGGSFPFGGIYRTIPEGADLAGRTFSFGVWAKCSSTAPYIKLSDGVGSTTVHLDGLDAFAFVTTPGTKIDSSGTEIRVDLVVPSGDVAYFDGGVLCEGDDLFTVFDTNIDISDWQPAINMNVDQYTVAERDGVYIPETRVGSKTLKIKGNVVGTDSTSTRTHFDNLLKSLRGWQNNEARELYLFDDRTMEVFLKGFSWNYVKTLEFMNYNLEVIVPRAVSKYISKTRKSQVIAGTVTEFSLAYDGNAEELPRISFIADQGSAITTCTLENLTTNQSFSYIGTVPTNVALDIDCFSPTVKNSSVDKIEDFTGEFIKLVRGTNNLKFSGSNCTIKIDYFNRWLS